MKKNYQSFHFQNFGSKAKKMALIVATLSLGITGLNAQYCVPVFPNGVEPITSVSFEDIDNQTSDDTESPAYEDFTSISASVELGESYPIEVQGNTHGSFTNKLLVFIDWNQDGEFDNSSEKYELTDLYSSTGMDGQLSTGTIEVPIDALPGTTVMRVLKRYSSLPEACNTLGYGQAEDYSIDVLGGTPCAGTPDAGVVDGPSTFGECKDEPFIIKMTGYTIAAGISYEWIGRPAGSTNASDWQTVGTSAVLNYPANAFNSDLEFCLVVTCDDSAESDTSDVVVVTLNPAYECYCEASCSSAYDYVSSVESSGATTNVSYMPGSQSTNGYADETQQLFESYETQEITFEVDYVGGNNIFNVWVDWNQDGIFNTDELMISGFGSSPQTISFNVPLGTPEGDYRMRTRGMYNYSGDGVVPPCGNTAYGTTIDFNLTILAPPSCLAPINLTNLNTTDVSTELSWTESGSATQWQVEYGEQGFEQGDGTLELADSNPYEITIQPETEYDYYVRAICGEGDTSYWSGPYSFDNIYCTPSTNISSEYLKSFKTEGAIIDLDYAVTSQPSGGYDDKTNNELVVYLGQTFDVITEYYNGSNTINAWVDWNSNFEFENDELILSSYGSNNGQTASMIIPPNTPIGTYRLRVRAQWSTGNLPPCGSVSYGSTVDFTIVVIDEPSCLPVEDLSVVSSTSDEIEIEWTAGDTETNWNVAWGEPGFDPNGTAAIGTDATQADSYTVTGLESNTAYDIYVQADCEADSLSYWTLVSAATECSSTTVPFLQDFEGATVPELPSCGSLEVNTGNAWKTQSLNSYGFDSQVLSYSYSSSSAADTWYFTQGIEMEAGINYVMTYQYGNNSDYNTEKLRVAYGTSPLSDQMTDTLTVHDDISIDGSKIDTISFSPAADGIYYFGFQVFSATNQYYLFLDDISIDFCDITPGINGSVDVCRLEGVVDLNTVITSEYTHGIWDFSSNPDLVEGSDFNVEGLPSGAYEVEYVVSNACTADTTIATVNIYPPSSAGDGGTVTVCKNSSINLYAGLSGNADMGGEWYDYNGNALPNSQPISSSIPGSFNYKYVVSNGICPADTAIIEVIVDASCDDGLSVGAEEFVELSVHPNPATSYLNIENPSNASNLQIDMLDMNGRVVLSSQEGLKNDSKMTLDISKLERGIYTLRLYNDEGQKTFKIVKQ